MDEVNQQTFDVWSILILNYKRKKTNYILSWNDGNDNCWLKSKWTVIQLTDPINFHL